MPEFFLRQYCTVQYNDQFLINGQIEVLGVAHPMSTCTLHLFDVVRPTHETDISNTLLPSTVNEVVYNLRSL